MPVLVNLEQRLDTAVLVGPLDEQALQAAAPKRYGKLRVDALVHFDAGASPDRDGFDLGRQPVLDDRLHHGLRLLQLRQFGGEHTRHVVSDVVKQENAPVLPFKRIEIAFE